MQRDAWLSVPTAWRGDLGVLPPPLAGEGWGGGGLHQSSCVPPPCPSPASGRGDAVAPAIAASGAAIVARMQRQRITIRGKWMMKWNLFIGVSVACPY